MKLCRAIRPPHTFIAALAVSAALSTALTACESDDKATDSSVGNTSAMFRVGLQGPLSGSQKAVGQGMLQGAELAAAKLNAQGGIRGQLVEIVPIDDQADPEVAKSAATAAVAAGLDAVVGPYNSGAGEQSLPIFIDDGFVPLRLTSADTTAGLGFTLQPMTSQIAPVASAAIGDWVGASSVAIVVDETQDYTKFAAEAIESSLNARGITVTSVTNISPGASSYSDAIGTALADAPDLIYVVTYYPEAAVIAADVQASGIDVTCMVDYGGFDQGYITSAGTKTAQTCSVVGVPSPSDYPESETLIDAFEDMFNVAPGSWSPYTYDSVLILADAIERANSTDAAALTEALASTSGWSGWTGAVRFETNTGNRLPAPVTLNRVTDDGKFTVDSTWATTVGFAF